MMNKIKELENKIKELSDEIEKLKNEPWKPKGGEWYWFISHGAEAKVSFWHGDLVDETRYTLGNAFKTDVEARFRVEQIKVEAELRRFSRPFVPNKNNYQLNYDHYSKTLCIDCVRNVQSNDIYFANKEIAQKAIDTVGEERIKKYYFGVED